MTSKASRLAAFSATANTQALASTPSSAQIAASYASLSDGASFTGGVSVANSMSAGNTTITGFANVSGNLIVGGSATVSGNLVVNGTTITVNTSQINVTDSLMYLASNNEVSDSLDIGFAGHYNNGAGANGHTGLVRSATTKKYHLFQNYQPEFFANNVLNTTGLEHAPLVVGQLTATSISANGSVGTNGQVLFSNGSVSYWGTLSGGGATLISNTTVNQTMYLPMSNTTSGAWSNAVVTNLTFNPSTSVLKVGNTSGNAALTYLGLMINDSYGSYGTVLKSAGSYSYWGSISSYDVGLGNVPNVDCTNAYNISSGAISSYILAPNGGQANNTSYLRGDGVWATPSVSASFTSLTGLTLTTPANGDVIVYNAVTQSVGSATYQKYTDFGNATWYNAIYISGASAALKAAAQSRGTGTTININTMWGGGSTTTTGNGTVDPNGNVTIPIADGSGGDNIQSFTIAAHTATSGGWKNSNTATIGISAATVGAGTAAPDPLTSPGQIRATGNITAFYSSDKVFKENVRDIADAAEIARNIGSKYFEWTDDYIEKNGGLDGYFVQKEDFGVIAQDVLKWFPLAVRKRPDGTLAVDYEKLGILAFGAIDQLMKRIEALESNNNK